MFIFLLFYGRVRSMPLLGKDYVVLTLPLLAGALVQIFVLWKAMRPVWAVICGCSLSFVSTLIGTTIAQNVFGS